MKLELDTTTKTITFLSKVSVPELIDLLEGLDNCFDLKEWSIIQKEIVPVPIELPTYPIYKPYDVYCGTGSSPITNPVTTSSSSITNKKPEMFTLTDLLSSYLKFKDEELKR